MIVLEKGGAFSEEKHSLCGCCYGNSPFALHRQPLGIEKAPALCYNGGIIPILPAPDHSHPICHLKMIRLWRFTMNRRAFTVSLEKNPLITMNVIPGHFTTSSSHISHYLDVSGLKSNALVARDVARELAIPYLSSTLVDTIVCMERTEVIGAYLAEELLQNGPAVMNADSEIYVVTPISNNIGTLSFQSSMSKRIVNRNILLLAASISSGRTLDSALDCIAYYGGNIVGISALFFVPNDKYEHEIHPLFTSDDIPDYRLYRARSCELCRAGQKLDALISSEGYTKI